MGLSLIAQPCPLHFNLLSLLRKNRNRTVEQSCRNRLLLDRGRKVIPGCSARIGIMVPVTPYPDKIQWAAARPGA